MRILLAILCLGFAAPSLWAQRVTGEVVSAEAAAPVQGAVIVLMDEQGRMQAGTLSDERGRFTLAASTGGRYRLKAELVGFETVFSPYLQVAAGQTVEHRLVVAPQAVMLQGITVRASSRCRPRTNAGETHRVWEETRKALTAVTLTEALRSVSFDIWTFDRELDRTNRVISERSSARQAVADYPFRSDPGAQLMRQGFVQQAGAGMVYHAPDPHVLLSDEFHNGYCFSLRRVPERPGMIGLAFEPMRQHRHVPGVTGALWLDESTGELRQLEYRYTRFPAAVAGGMPTMPDPAAYGGRLDFERLENGAWIVRAWTIRAPNYYTDYRAARPDASGTSLGVRESGGDVRAIYLPVRTRQLRVPAGVIQGRVLDSDERTPVEGAVVYLSGTQYKATTDHAGEFRIAEVPEGRYLVAAYHEELDIDGALLPTREVAVTASEDTAVELLLPGLTAQMAITCVGQAGKGGTLVAGIVRDAATGIVLGGARVELHPTDGRGPVLHATADETGRYRICAVPPGRSYRARALFVAYRSADRELTVAADEVVRSDFAIDLRPPLRLVGRVLDEKTQQPIASARVRILDIDRVSLTDAQGRFAIESVPAGEHRVEVTHLAYGAHSELVRVRGGQAAELTIHLGVQAIAIEGVVVTAATRSPVGLEDFSRRMAQSRGGVFLDRTAIEQRGALRVEDMLSDYGITVDGSGVVMPRAFSGFGVCGPMVYIDGIAVTKLNLHSRAVAPEEARDALRMVHPILLAGMEIYRGASQVPIELGGTGGGCGVIALWTRRGP